MLKWLLHRRIRAFERAFDYDLGYARELLEIDAGAFLKFAMVNAMTGYRRDVPRDVAYAVKLTGTIAEDCGPCTQLMVTMALKEGVDPGTISAIVRGDEATMSDQVKLGVAFGRAVLAHDPAADALRDEIVERWGPRALVSLAFAITGARIYPTLKYALGHGKTCQRVVVGGETMPVARLAA
jgi:hypothetical protein